MHQLLEEFDKIMAEVRDLKRQNEDLFRQSVVDDPNPDEAKERLRRIIEVEIDFLETEKEFNEWIKSAKELIDNDIEVLNL